MRLDIDPFIGVGKIKFGMSQKNIRVLLNSKCKSFMKTPNADYETDVFPDLGFSVYYNKLGYCKAVEFFPSGNVVYKDIELFRKDFTELLEYFKKETEVEIDVDGLTMNKIGIGIYAPGHNEDAYCYPEGVIAFEEGYYG